MFVVGLTGGIGSGKSTVAGYFNALGIEVVDADLSAREVVEPGRPALSRIAAHFGAGFIDAGGNLARHKLREFIFRDPGAKAWLEALLHPLIAELMTSRIQDCRSPYCLLVSPLLMETGQRSLVNRILVVDVTEQTQLQRTLGRDQSDEATIKSIIAAQINRTERLRQADDVLDNERSPDLVEQEVKTLHRRYLELAGEHEA